MKGKQTGEAPPSTERNYVRTWRHRADANRVGGSRLSHSASSTLRFSTIRCARISTMARRPRHLRSTSYDGAGGGGGVCHDAGGIGERP